MRNSNISWTKPTWNPLVGCRKVSSACNFFYMHRILEKGEVTPNTVIKSVGKFKEPLKWSIGRKIFTCSMSGFFIEEADQWRDKALEVIKNTKQHTYMILTKRPDQIKENFPKNFENRQYPKLYNYGT
jgi:protein gp37